MSLRDLAGKHQTDARSIGFGGEERDEEVVGVGEARPVVLDKNLDETIPPLGSAPHKMAK